MNLLRAFGAVSSMTLVSRILGFARDLLIARMFGAGAATDAFFVAFKLPNLLRRIFAEGAFSQAFVPILAEYRNQRGEADTRLLVDHVAGTLAVALIGVTALGILAAPAIVWLSAPGFTADPDKFALTVDLLRITFPYILFISLTALGAGILNTYSRFSVPAFAPALLNLSFIAFAVWFAPYFDPPVEALAWAVFVGGLLQLAFLVPFLRRLRMLPRPRWGGADEGVRRVLRQMGPALFGVSVGQVSLLINTVFASFLASGSVSWLYYADRLMEFPTGLLGVALGTILLPSLARSHADRTTEEYGRLLDWGLRITLMLAAPAAVALAVLSDDPGGVDGLQRRADRTDRGEGARARVLRPAGHTYAGEDRAGHAGRDAGDEPAVHPGVCACRPRAGDRSRGVPQCMVAAARVAPHRCLSAAAGLGDVRAEDRCRPRADGRRTLVDGGALVAVAGLAGARARAPALCRVRRRWRCLLRRTGRIRFPAEGFLAPGHGLTLQAAGPCVHAPMKRAR